MKTKFFLGFVLITFCSYGQSPAKRKVSPEVSRLANSITPLLNFRQNSDSCKKALLFLDSATAIDNSCFNCYQNKIMFLVSLKEYKKAISANENLLRLAPNAHDLYMTGGVLYEIIGDTISSKKYFNKSLVICNTMLDTMSNKNRAFLMFTTNQAINLIMLNNSIKANKVLKDLYESQPDDPEYDNVEKKYIQSLMNKTRMDLIDHFKQSRKK